MSIGNKISVRFLQPNDVIRFKHKEGEVVGIVLRTYMSGGRYGARVTGTLPGFEGFLQSVDLHIQEGQILELLWREEEKAKSETQG